MTFVAIAAALLVLFIGVRTIRGFIADDQITRRSDVHIRGLIRVPP
jgi:hypothetical protein